MNVDSYVQILDVQVSISFIFVVVVKAWKGGKEEGGEKEKHQM